VTSDEHIGDPLLCPNRPPWVSRCRCARCADVPDPRQQIELTRVGEAAVRRWMEE